MYLMQQTEDQLFDVFWKSYPKRVKKICAHKEWTKLRGVDFEAILQGIERWKQTKQWQDIQFIPDPERFLKYRRWEDEIPMTKQMEEHMQIVTEGGPRKEYMEFVQLRDSGKLRGVTWDSWSKLTPEQRQQFLHPPAKTTTEVK